jgi:hypothetical protein
MAIELKLIDKKCWQISPYLAEYLSVQEGDRISLYAGAAHCQVIVEIIDYYPGMNLYEKWANDLGLSPGLWKVRRTPEGVRLGPIIGIVCQKPPNRSPNDSAWTHYFSQFEGGQLILMTPEGFDLSRLYVNGYTLSSDKKEWIRTKAPWPDALYIRTYPIEASFQDFLNKEFNNRYFNSSTQFNKWTVFQHLSQFKEIKTYLPDTAILRDTPKQLKNWINQYSSVYLKPLHGNKGNGILNVTRAYPDRSLYRVRYRKDQLNIDQNLLSTLPIRYLLNSIMQERAYLVQQAISIPSKMEATSDFRVLLQKKDDGQWHMTGFGGRRGAVGSIVNNIDNGGERIHLSTLLQDDPFSKRERLKEINSLCFNIAFILEQHFGILGEIGFDLCIDETHRLWLLEVNGMPSKKLFTKFFAPSVVRNVYSAPLLYASYLSGFTDVINPMV